MTNPYATQQRASLDNAPAQHAEGWALIEAARRMDAARVNPDDSDTVLTSVRLNWRIWTIIQAALVDPECPLPKQIRENLINLSNFIDKRSAQMIANPKSVEKMDVLININRQIGAGLLGNAGENADANTAQTAPAQTAAPPPAAPVQTQQPAPANPNSGAYSKPGQDSPKTSDTSGLGRSTSTEV